jgi:hypothetical protein
LLVDAAKAKRIAEAATGLAPTKDSALPRARRPKTAWEAWQWTLGQRLRSNCQAWLVCVEALAADVLAVAAAVLFLAALGIWVKNPPGGTFCDDDDGGGGSGGASGCTGGGDGGDGSDGDGGRKQRPGIGTVLAFFPLGWVYWGLHAALWEFHPWGLAEPPGHRHSHSGGGSNKSSSSSSGSGSVCEKVSWALAAVARALCGACGFGQWQRERAKVRVGVCKRLALALLLLPTHTHL